MLPGATRSGFATMSYKRRPLRTVAGDLVVAPVRRCHIVHGADGDDVRIVPGSGDGPIAESGSGVRAAIVAGRDHHYDTRLPRVAKARSSPARPLDEPGIAGLLGSGRRGRRLARNMVGSGSVPGRFCIACPPAAPYHTANRPAALGSFPEARRPIGSEPGFDSTAGLSWFGPRPDSGAAPTRVGLTLPLASAPHDQPDPPDLALPAGLAGRGPGDAVPPGPGDAPPPADRRRPGRGGGRAGRPLGPLGGPATGADRGGPADPAAGRPGGGGLVAGGRAVLGPGRAGGGPDPLGPGRLARPGVPDRPGAGRRLGPEDGLGRPGPGRPAPDHRPDLPAPRHRPADGPGPRPGRPAFDWRPFGPETEAEFRAVLQETYAGSLDMPELEGIRSLDDVMASHRAAGRFDPTGGGSGPCPGDPGARGRAPALGGPRPPGLGGRLPRPDPRRPRPRAGPIRPGLRPRPGPPPRPPPRTRRRRPEPPGPPALRRRREHTN